MFWFDKLTIGSTKLLTTAVVEFKVAIVEFVDTTLEEDTFGTVNVFDAGL